MPTIAEIIAAKKRSAAPAAPQTPQADPVLEAAIDRIDPPSVGKRRAGLVLSASTPLPAAVVAEKAHHAELRSLSQPQGEALPVLPVAADAATTAWHAAINAFESELCLMRDPVDSERGWLALRLDGQAQPLLLKSFMLFDHPQTVRSQPF
jgi:hypothetical protein